MRKILLALIVLGFLAPAMSQNVQLHYDFGKDRQYLTSTVEMFKPDKWGNTFFFIDMDYGNDEIKGVQSAYWEIARAVSVCKKVPIALHLEYNGGFGQFYTQTGNYAFQINNAYLGGVEYSKNNSDFTKGFTLQAMYKYIQGKNNNSFQLTGVWYMHMLKKKLSFTGFADFWREDNTYTTPENPENPEKTKFVFLSEPQLWYNFTQNLSAGGEVELSSNFGGVKGFAVNPTLALKWNF